MRVRRQVKIGGERAIVRNMRNNVRNAIGSSNNTFEPAIDEAQSGNSTVDDPQFNVNVTTDTTTRETQNGTYTTTTTRTCTRCCCCRCCRTTASTVFVPIPGGGGGGGGSPGGGGGGGGSGTIWFCIISAKDLGGRCIAYPAGTTLADVEQDRPGSTINGPYNSYPECTGAGCEAVLV